MSAKTFFQSFLTVSIGLSALTISSLTYATQKANAFAGTACPDEGSAAAAGEMSDDCDQTPEVYETKFYELGLCTSDPFAGGSFSNSTCEKVWDDANGVTVDIAACMNSDCDVNQGTVYRPTSNTYTYSYVVINNSFKFKGKVYFNGQTYYSTSTDKVESTYNNYSTVSTDSNDYAAYTQEYNYLGDASGGSYPNCWDWAANVESETVKAYLANNSLTTPTTQAECSAATKLIGSVQLATSIKITDKTNNYRLTWDISKKGMWVDNDSPDTSPTGIGAGPFSLTLEVWE